VGAYACSMCQPGTYANVSGATACTDCAPGHHNEDFARRTPCRVCDSGRSTNGQSGASYATGECPICEDGYYCDHYGCGACDECSITEYTTGDAVGHLSPSSCLSWDAAFGFNHPGQCGITWIIIACVLCPFITVCVATWYIRCKRVHPPSEKAATIEYHDHHHHGAAELELADSSVMEKDQRIADLEKELAYYKAKFEPSGPVFQPQQPHIEPYLEEKWSPRREEKPDGIVAI